MHNNIQSRKKTGLVYKISCNVTGFMYIGSTTKKLGARLYHHEAKYKAWTEKKLNYMYTSFICLVNEDYNVSTIERVIFDDINELHKREHYWINQIDCVNLINPVCNNEYAMKYYYKNKNEILNRRKEYYKLNKEKIKKRARERYHQLKDGKLKPGNKRGQNKSIPDRVYCECGKYVSGVYYKRHIKTKSHIKKIKQLNAQSGKENNISQI